MSRWITFAFRILYQGLISPVLHWLAGPGYGCRFEPTCSRYCAESLKRFGLLQGSFYAARRVLRCHPFARAGFDPVPVVGGTSHPETQ